MAAYTGARSFGSASLGVCAAAEGPIDGYVEADLDEYDWAAAALIAEEAGVEVRHPAGEDLVVRVEISSQPC